MSDAAREITSELESFIAGQQLFFVATAPASVDGHLNLSPKGLDTFAVLDPRTVAYLDLTGSGVETIAHLRENGRVTVMFCAFDDPPLILRLYGRGRVVIEGDEGFGALRGRFPPYEGTRAVIVIDVERVATSCGWGVPRYELAGDRDKLVDWAVAKGPDGIAAYQRSKNAQSIDGLPGLG